MKNPTRNLLVAGFVTFLLGIQIGWGQVDVPRATVPHGQPRAFPVRQTTHQAGLDRVPNPVSAQAYPREKPSFGLQTPRTLSGPTVPSRNPWVRTISSLVVVAGLMLGFIWWTRKNQPDRTFQLPNDLVEVIGRVTLDAKHKAHLVRFGDRVLLLSLDGPGISKLGEIGIPDTASQAPRNPTSQGPASYEQGFTTRNESTRPRRV